MRTFAGACFGALALHAAGAVTIQPDYHATFKLFDFASIMGKGFQLTEIDGLIERAFSLRGKGGDFQIISLIGSGENGVVYRVKDGRSIEFAVKAVHLCGEEKADVEKEYFYMREYNTLKEADTSMIQIGYVKSSKPQCEIAVLKLPYLPGLLVSTVNASDVGAIERLQLSILILEDIQRMQDKSLIHCDLHYGNVMTTANPADLKTILSGDDEEAKKQLIQIIDFGFACSSEAYAKCPMSKENYTIPCYPQFGPEDCGRNLKDFGEYAHNMDAYGAGILILQILAPAVGPMLETTINAYLYSNITASTFVDSTFVEVVDEYVNFLYDMEQREKKYEKQLEDQRYEVDDEESKLLKKALHIVLSTLLKPAISDRNVRRAFHSLSELMSPHKAEKTKFNGSRSG